MQPKYLQITQQLTRDIAAGHLLDGQKLPTEKDMAQTLGISVGTLRKALDQLASQGLLERIHGSGNYIRADSERDSLYSLFRIERRSGRGKPSAEILSADYVQKATDLPAFGSATHANRVRRLRRLDGIAVAIEEIWLDGSAGQLNPEQLSSAMYRDYNEQLNLMISHAVDAVSIAAVPTWSPDSFQPKPGSICGYIERTAWSEQGNSVEFSRTWFDTEQAIYVQRLR